MTIRKSSWNNISPKLSVGKPFPPSSECVYKLDNLSNFALKLLFCEWVYKTETKNDAHMCQLLSGGTGQEIIFTESAPRPIQSIGCHVRGRVWLFVCPLLRDWEIRIWQKCFQLVATQNKLFSHLCVWTTLSPSPLSWSIKLENLSNFGRVCP